MSSFAGLGDQIAASLDVSDAILDGEVIAADETGRFRQAIAEEDGVSVYCGPSPGRGLYSSRAAYSRLLQNNRRPRSLRLEKAGFWSGIAVRDIGRSMSRKVPRAVLLSAWHKIRYTWTSSGQGA